MVILYGKLKLSGSFDMSGNFEWCPELWLYIYVCMCLCVILSFYPPLSSPLVSFVISLIWPSSNRVNFGPLFFFMFFFINFPISHPPNTPLFSLIWYETRCCRNDFVCCCSIFLCYQPAELIWGFFCFINFIFHSPQAKASYTPGVVGLKPDTPNPGRPLESMCLVWIALLRVKPFRLLFPEVGVHLLFFFFYMKYL